MIGQIIDNRYHIEAVLGQGAMGTVYRALDSQQDKIVALKTLHLNFSVATENALSRFNREFRVLAQLEHTGIVGAYGHGDYQGIPYLVMEYLDGQTLKDRLAEGPLPPELLHHITIQICQALAHIHSRSIVHRDLKPGNIMLLPPYDAPQVKLMDFGLVRVSDLSAQLTQEGMTLGTVAYMAPEQAQGFPVDSYADLYALGAILYEMATGRPPFVNENPVTVLMHQITASPLSPRHFNANLEEGLDRLILDLLAKEPSLRPANADTVLQRLSHLEDEAPPAPTSAQSVSRRIPRIPLIGRQDAMAHLMEHWLQAQTGAGRVLLLSGEAGAGKTRFLQEAGSHVRNSNGKFTRGVCRETASLPYQPFVDLLDGMLKQLTPAEQKLVPPEIARLLPSLANQVDEAPSGDPAEARLHTFSAFWQMLQRKSADQPVLFAIEDIQWADPSTLDLLDYLASRIDQANILFVFTYRPEEAASSPQLMTLLQNMERTPSTQQLTLNLLSREQVGEYLNIALRQENISDWLIDNFYQATEGNPLFLEETLKALVAEDEVSRWIEMDQSTSQRSMLRNMPLQLPKSVLSLAERRLQVLSDQDRSILTAAAVIGAEFPFAMLQEL
ncbi:MAG: protein kinase, partial [Chloroflexota bacterium]